MEKIYQYFQGDAIESPVVLRHAVWYFLVIHFVTGSRGLEFHHQLRIDSFDGTGEFASPRHETLQDYHQLTVTHTKECMHQELIAAQSKS